MQINTKVKYGKIENIIKALSDDFSVKVGLVKSKGSDEEISDNLDIAGLGAVHEFGAKIPVTDKMRAFFRWKFKINLKKSTTHIIIPARSFITMPVSKTSKLKSKIKSQIGDADDVLYYIEKTGDIESIAIIVGASAQDVILEAFETGGWGEWQADSSLTIANKGSAMPLVDKGNLKRRIGYEIERK